MDPARSIELLGLVACLVVVGLASAADAALSAVTRHRMNQHLESGERRATALMRLLEDPYRFRLSTLVLSTSATIVATTLLMAFVRDWGGWQQAGALLGLLVVWLTLGTTLPKSLATAHPDGTGLLVARPMGLLLLLIAPVNWTLSLLARPIGMMTGANPQLVTEEELKLLVNVGEEEGVIEAEEREMIEGIFEFSDTVVREVMVPRIDIVAVPATASLDEALALVLGAGHSRLPVYQDSVDHVVGVLYAKDLLPVLRDNRRDQPLSALVRPAYFVPDTMKVDDLMRALQSRKVHIALIVDEYGGTAGLVTIEDLLEEIVGEIQDEYDVEEPPIQEVGAGAWLFNSRISLDEVNDLAGLHLANEDVDSLGGYVASILGTIPKVGDSITAEGATIEVLAVHGLRPERLKIVVPQPVIEQAATVGESQDEHG
ncbi:MAG TPA: hemolysin family protein [Herpetosiphonaceae bacterium]